MDTWISSPNYGPALQSILMQNLFGGTYDNWLIEGNIFCSTLVHGITNEVVLSNSKIVNNTLLRPWHGDVNGDGLTDHHDGFFNYPAPTIRVIGNGDVVVQNNICEAVTLVAGTPVIRDNHTALSRFDKTTYSVPLQGTDFAPLTIADLTNQARMVANGVLDVDNSGGPTLGDMGAVGTTIDNGFYDFTNKTLLSAMQTPRLSDVVATTTGATTADLGYITDARTGPVNW
ncbi:MAG: hypothetical protein GXP16_12040, partial [Gammaproteobacteria bacterium]|nr:hypothetical protein [Gammaproteobacteria bacterium]